MSLKNSFIFESFSTIVKSHPNKIAITFKLGDIYQNITYQHIFSRSIQFAKLLQSRAIVPGDKVAIALENQPAYVMAFMGTMCAGATAVPLDAQFSGEEIHRLLKHSESKLLVLTKQLYVRIKPLISDTTNVIVVDEENSESQLAQYDLDVSMFMSSNTLAALFYTSGTTDLPKAVMLTHANLLANVESIKQLNIVTSSDSIISFLPLHHTYPFTVTLLMPLMLGATIIYPSGMASMDLLSCMKETRPTIFVGVPQVFTLMYHSINKKLKAISRIKKALVKGVGSCLALLRQATSINLSTYLFAQIHEGFGKRLRFMVSGGARLDPEVAEGFTRWGFHMLEGYGLTETSPVSAFNPVDKPKIGSVGKPVSDVEIKICKPDARGIGEVAIKGSNVMAGYFKMPEQTAEVVREGWFFSGDLGHFDEEGYLYLTGRKKEMIVLSNGKNINPEEIEHHYCQNPFIKDMCVLAVKASGFLSGVEQLVAVIVIDEDYFKAKGEMNIRGRLKWELDNLSARMPGYRRIKGFVISQEPLEHTRLGKIMRHKMETVYHQLSEGGKTKEKKWSGNEVQEEGQVCSHISRVVMGFLEKTFKRKIHMSDHLELDLGLDSLGRAELLLSLQDTLKLELSPDAAMDFFMSNTVQELLEKLKIIMPQVSELSSSSEGFAFEKVLRVRPSEEVLEKIALHMGFWYKMINLIIIGFIKLSFRTFFLLKTEGRANLKHEGPYLICSNHTSYLDGLFILSALPFKVALNTYFVGESRFFEHFLLKPMIRLSRLIPLEMSFNLVETLRTCAFVLRNRKIICYFPEGQRSIDGDVKDFKKGVGILIKECEASVIPVYIEGAFYTWPRGAHFPRLAPVKVKFGRMLSADDLVISCNANEDVYAEVARNLREKVLALRNEK